MLPNSRFPFSPRNISYSFLFQQTNYLNHANNDTEQITNMSGIVSRQFPASEYGGGDEEGELALAFPSLSNIQAASTMRNSDSFSLASSPRRLDKNDSDIFVVSDTVANLARSPVPILASANRSGSAPPCSEPRIAMLAATTLSTSKIGSDESRAPSLDKMGVTELSIDRLLLDSLRTPKDRILLLRSDMELERFVRDSS